MNVLWWPGKDHEAGARAGGEATHSKLFHKGKHGLAWGRRGRGKRDFEVREKKIGRPEIKEEKCTKRRKEGEYEIQDNLLGALIQTVRLLPRVLDRPLSLTKKYPGGGLDSSRKFGWDVLYGIKSYTGEYS